MSLLSMNQVSTFRWSLDQDVERYCQAGYDGIGVWRQKLADYGEQEGIELIRASGLRATNLMWAGGFTGSDGRSVEESVADAAEAIRTAAALEAPCLVLYSGGRNNHILSHAARLLRAALDPLVDLAGELDVTLAIEPMHAACAADWTFLTDVESALDFVQSYDAPHLQLAIDSYHFAHDQALLANLDQIVPWTALVHLGDRREPHGIDHNRAPLGTGRLPLMGFIQGLRDAGYAGDFDVKLLGREFDPRRYDALLHGSREFFERCAAPVESK